MHSDLNRQHSTLRERIPQVFTGFALLSNAATTAAELDTTTKELVAPAIGGVRGCHVSYPLGWSIPYPARYLVCLAKT